MMFENNLFLWVSILLTIVVIGLGWWLNEQFYVPQSNEILEEFKAYILNGEENEKILFVYASHITNDTESTKQQVIEYVNKHYPEYVIVDIVFKSNAYISVTESNVNGYLVKIRKR